MDKKTQVNQKTWNKVAPLFKEASALPVWGPFSSGRKLNLLEHVKGKTLLEIGCGSGRSINYLIQHGAKKVYGIDFSTKQLEEAARYNHEATADGKVKLINAPMEEKQDIDQVDIVYSIYAFGWTQKPEKTLENIRSYLKEGGNFIWSWDHTFFTDVVYEHGKYIVQYSYHEEKPLHLKDWKGEEAHFIYRKTATWFKLLRDAGFMITGYYEPEPEDLARGHDDPAKYYSIQKARLVPSTFIFVCQK